MSSRTVIHWLAGALLISALTSPALASEKYLCVAEKSTGFQWNGSGWDIVKSEVDKTPYVVREVDVYSYASKKLTNFEVWQSATALPQHRCFRTRSNSTYARFMHCGGPGFGFTMYFDTLRFQEYYGIGYHDNTAEPGEVQEIIMGKCSRAE